MIRQSAAAAPVIAIDAISAISAISARNPVLDVMSPPTRGMPDAAAAARGRMSQVTQPALAFKPLTPC